MKLSPAAADKEAEFWSKMKQLEVQFYQMIQIDAKKCCNQIIPIHIVLPDNTILR